jgi:AraC family transcriptional regulator
MDLPELEGLSGIETHRALPEALKLAHLLGNRAPLLDIEEQAHALVAILTPEPFSGTTSPSWISMAEHYLNEHYSTQTPLKELARLVGVHPVHLAKTFKRARGCTIGTYVKRLRLAHALLSGSNLGQAAVEAGFYDQNHLCRVSRLELGSTPKMFRDALSRI